MCRARVVSVGLLISILLILPACVSVPAPGTGACQGPVLALEDVDQPPEPIKRVRPRIPTEVARKTAKVIKSRKGQVQIQGETKLKFVVNLDGSLCQISLVKSSGLEEIDKATILALKQWRFDPARHNGKPARVKMTQTIEYIFKSR